VLEHRSAVGNEGCSVSASCTMYYLYQVLRRDAVNERGGYVAAASIPNDRREAAKTVRGMKWARAAELEMELDGKKIVKYRTTTKIYFDIEK
jgi:flavin-binding protein dodecin